MGRLSKRSNAICHPDRVLHGNGLCRPCYSKEYKRIHGSVQPRDLVKFQNLLRRLYKISLEDYYALLEKQKGLCAICSKTSNKRKLVVDHDHVSGRVRGLLCHKCNSAIGLLDDSTFLVQKALNYLIASPNDIKTVLKGYPPIADKVICIDFDNTLYPISGIFSYPAPLEGAVDAVNLLKSLGYTIVIWTSRLSKTWLEFENLSAGEQLYYISQILRRDGIPFDYITAEKIPASHYIDDKAITFTTWQDVRRRYEDSKG